MFESLMTYFSEISQRSQKSPLLRVKCWWQRFNQIRPCSHW